MYWLVFLSRFSKEWTIVSKEEAQQNRYYGFKGWLLLLYLAFLYGIIQNLIVVFAPPGSVLADYAGGGNPDMFGGDHNVMRGVFLAQALVAVPFLVLAPLKHALTPKVWIGSVWIGVVVSAATIDMPGQTDAMLGLIAFSVVLALLITWYALHSKRVNVTYLSRVPAGDATSQPRSLFAESDSVYSRIGWIVAGIVGFLVLAGVLGTLLPS